MKSFYRLAPFFVSLTLFLISTGSNAETVERSTEYSSPYGSYSELTAINSLTVGIAPGSPQDTGSNAATGTVTVNGSLQISNGPTIIDGKLAVDGDTLKVLPYPYWYGQYWVNIGQPSPEYNAGDPNLIHKLADLNVYGDIYSLRYFHVAMRFSEKDLYLGTDSTTTPVWGEMGSRDGNDIWRTAFFKANHKIVLNSGGTGRSSGPVLIGATPTEAIAFLGGVANYNSYKLIVNGVGKAQSFDGPSSREYKTNIQPLTTIQYNGILDKLSKTDIFHFRYKAIDAPTQKLHTGIIAENGPEEMLSPDKRGVDVSNSIGFLMAATKELVIENEALEKEIVKLEKEINLPQREGKAHGRLAK